MFGCQAAAVRHVDIRFFRNANQRVVRFVNISGRKESLVRRDQRQIHFIRPRDQRFLGDFFLHDTVALQFNVQPVGENFRQFLQSGFRQILFAVDNQAVDRAGQASRQANQAFGMLFQRLEINMRFGGRLRVHISDFGQFAQIVVPDLVLHQQHQAVGMTDVPDVSHTVFVHAQIDIGLFADNGLNAVRRARLRHFERAEHIVRVGHGDGGHTELFAHADQIVFDKGELGFLFLHFDFNRAFQQRICRMHAQMNEIRRFAHVPSD